jgi:L-asparaginase / beta-aspartyl-peptidase
MKSIIVHGGAWDIPVAMLEDHTTGMTNAINAGWEILMNKGSATDAVVAAINVMEEDPTFDAGRGSFANLVGQIELDASIMDGRTLRAGAVAAVRNILHPITLARIVMDKSEHVLLVSDGAMRFAGEHNIPLCEADELLVGREFERWKEIQARGGFSSKETFAGSGTPRDTVGCVAIDDEGNIASGTSTGGTPNKYPGRVGDSPLIGCGTYAMNSAGGVSTTGFGESIIKVVLAKTIVDAMDIQKMKPQEAAKYGIDILHSRVEGFGGVIVLAPDGNHGVAFNTPRMARAYMNESMDQPDVTV